MLSQSYMYEPRLMDKFKYMSVFGTPRVFFLCVTPTRIHIPTENKLNASCSEIHLSLI